MSQNRNLVKRLNPEGFTLVEIIVAGAILILILGGIMHIFSQFQRGYSKGEASVILLQEGGVFLGLLRQDLVNAIQDPSIKPDQWQKSILSTPKSLIIHRFKDRQGKTEAVEYKYETTPGESGSITRFTNGKQDRRLVKKHITGLEWNVESALYPGIGSPVKQIWVNLDAELSRTGKGGTSAVPFHIHTKLFPTRLNQLLNR